MSEAEITYIVQQQARAGGDVELIVNAMGEYQAEQPFPFGREYESFAEETAHGSATVRMVRTTRNPRYNHQLLQYGEDMKNGVHEKLSPADRQRIASHFVGVLPKNELYSE